MAEHSTIEWTDATWNPVTGCSIVSPGCTNCYAMKLAGTRLQHHPSRAGLTISTKAGPVWNGTVRLNEDWLDQPLRWKRPRMIFVCAHGDLFHEDVPDEWILDALTVMAIADHHTFQVLTKRAERMQEFLSRPDLLNDIYANWYTFSGGAREVQSWPLPNVWVGCSAEDQQRYDQRRRWLDHTNATVKFWSIEPMLGPIAMNIRHIRPDWVIAGGESGAGARPMHPDWARQLRDQCTEAGVPFFFKQWGDWEPATEARGHIISNMAQNGAKWVHNDGLVNGPSWHRADGRIDTEPFAMVPVGKKRAGRLLDGVEHNGMPQAREVQAI